MNYTIIHKWKKIVESNTHTNILLEIKLKAINTEIDIKRQALKVMSVIMFSSVAK